MPRGKSVLVSMEVTTAGKSHNCRFNKAHRIAKGKSRLTIKEDRAKLHYCLECARRFVLDGLSRLQEYQTQLDNLFLANVPKPD